jgi:hypothetical protein
LTDPLRLAASALAAGIVLGLAVITATVLGVDALRPAVAASDPGARFYLLIGGTLGGIVLASLATWLLLAPISSSYRRGGLALVSGFATVPLMLLCRVVHQLAGRPGLLALLGLLAAAGLAFTRHSRRLGAAG